MKNFEIEKDPELDNLLAKCKEKGLKFGLALGSGSARGMAHIGVIQALEAYHIPIDMIAGTSIGAVVGSVYAAVATDIKTGAKVILNQGSVIRAVRASFSIPGIFTPVKYQDYYLVDGGLVDPVPADVVKKMGADVIIAVSLTQKSPNSIVMIVNRETGDLKEVEDLFNFRMYKVKNPRYKVVNKITSLVEKEVTSLGKKIKGVKKKLEGPHIIEVIFKSIDIMEKEITTRGLIGANVVIIPFGIDGISLFEFDKADITIKGGIDAALAKIPQIKEVIKEKLK